MDVNALDVKVKANILLVDDRPENLVALKAILESLGQEVSTASSGAEALRCLLQETYAVVILDVQMPGMDGFEVMTLMHDNPRTRTTPVILMTAMHDSDDALRRGYQVGAVDYLFKPFPSEVLLAKVRVFVNLYCNTMRLRMAERRACESRLAQVEEQARVQSEARQFQLILRELEFARNIQRSILPVRLSFPGLSLYSDIRAAQRVGGDFFDVISDANVEPTIVCVIGDVTGKGMPAAMTMVLALTVLREICRLHQTPLELLTAANQRIFQQLHTLDAANNVSVVCASLNCTSRVMRYGRAGHPEPLRWSAATRKVEALSSHGLFLGVFEDGEFEEKTVQLDVGDKVLLYTDGITGARNAAGELFGHDRLTELVERHGHQEVEPLGRMLLAAVDDFQSGCPQADDIALLIMGIE